MTTILSTKGLEFKSIIAYPDLSVEKGSINFIIGPSGCGKSTLLRLFNATNTPSRGNIFFNGTAMPPESELKEYMKICCLDFSLNAPCDVMSGGEKQRVFLAVALSLHPEILLLDEPTSALDMTSANYVIENIINCCRQNLTTLIVVSHDRGLQEKYAETVIKLEENRK